MPPSAASQAIAARTLRGQGSYPPTAPTLNSNALGTHNTIKQPLLLTPPPPSYATATARARQLHESMLKFVHEIFSLFFLISLALTSQVQRSIISIALIITVIRFSAFPLSVAFIISRLTLITEIKDHSYFSIRF